MELSESLLCSNIDRALAANLRISFPDITQDKGACQGVTSLHVLTYVKPDGRLSDLQEYFKVGDGLGDKADSPKKHQFQTELTHKVTCGFGPYETLTNSVNEFILLLLTRFHEE